MRLWEDIYKRMRPTHFYVDNSVMYVSIPKNSSKQWRMKVFSHQINIDNPPLCEHAFAIIRDPHDRLISGITEWIKRKRKRFDVEYVLDNFEQLIPEQDEHLIPQHYFTSEYDFTLINFNQQVAHAGWLTSTYGVRHNPRLRGTPGKTDPLATDIRTCRIVQQFYPTDQELWNAVN